MLRPFYAWSLIWDCKSAGSLGKEGGLTTNGSKSESISCGNRQKRHCCGKLILNRGGEVVLYDGNTALDEKEIKARFEEGAKVNVVLGEIKRSDLLGVELCIISPGIPLTSPFVAVVDEARIRSLEKSN